MGQRNETGPEVRRKAMGTVIRALRGRRTQAQLARLLGNISQATISAWEKGHVDLTYEQVREIEVALGVRLGTVGIASGYVDVELGMEDEKAVVGADAAEPAGVGRRPQPVGFIERIWYSDVQEAVDAVQAADLLNLGVCLRSLRIRSDDDDTETLEWTVEVVAEVPMYSEEDDAYEPHPTGSA